MNGQTFDAKTDMECTLSRVKREPIVGVDGTHGAKETAEPAMVSGTITVGPDTDVQALVDTTDATVIVEFRSGKKFALYHACYGGDRQGEHGGVRDAVRVRGRDRGVHLMSPSPTTTEAAVPSSPEQDLADALETGQFRLLHPARIGSEGDLVEEMCLRPNGRAMRGFSYTTTGDGGVVFEPYKFAELGLRLAEQPAALLDRMHPQDITRLGTLALGFTVGGPKTGRSSSR